MPNNKLMRDNRTSLFIIGFVFLLILSNINKESSIKTEDISSTVIPVAYAKERLVSSYVSGQEYLETISTSSSLGVMPKRTREVLGESEIYTLNLITEKTKQEWHIELDEEDPEYQGVTLNITGKNREILERLVMGEAKGEGLTGQLLVAQCIRDTMVMTGKTDINWIIEKYEYAGSLKEAPSESVKEAVRIIFDKGDYVVKHRIIYFYAPKWVKGNRSSFHEKQIHKITYGGHKFFDERPMN